MLQGSPPAQEPLLEAFPHPAQPLSAGHQWTVSTMSLQGRKEAGLGGREVVNSEQRASRGVRGADCPPRFHKSRQGTTAAESALSRWSAPSPVLCLRNSPSNAVAQQATVQVVVVVTCTARPWAAVFISRALEKSVIFQRVETPC